MFERTFGVLLAAYVGCIGPAARAATAVPPDLDSVSAPTADTRNLPPPSPIANDRAMLGDREGARKLLVDALEANPFHTSAYNDLGDAVLVAWDVPRAWRSGDAGRRIAPRFPNYAGVERFERSLVAEHPEFLDRSR